MIKLLVVLLLLVPAGLGGSAAPTAANRSTADATRGPLSVLASNPRYFADRTGRPVYLTGSHVWWNLISRTWRVDCLPTPSFHYLQHLRWLGARGHNFLRLWRLEHTRFVECGQVVKADLQPWPRTDRGRALDGRGRFDLSRFNSGYFAALRHRVRLARAHGIYVSVMLFDGWATQFYEPEWRWRTHPFRSANNVNGVEGDLNRDGVGIEINTLANRRVLAIQERYVRKVVATLNGFDNVLYEIVNEAGRYSTSWQHHMIGVVKRAERRGGRRHPIGMTFQNQGGDNSTLFRSQADWVSPGGRQLLADPPPTTGRKVVLLDSDHLCGHSCKDPDYVWKAFLRGYNPVYMDTTQRDPNREAIRRAMGATARFANRINLAQARPLPALASTGYCLAASGRAYLAYQPAAGAFDVDLRGATGNFVVEWFEPASGRTIQGASVSGGAARSFAPPFGGPAVLYLRRS